MNKDEICRLVKKALFAARKAAELVFVGPLTDEPTKIRKESGAVDFALLGLSYIQTARVLVATTGEPDPLFDQIATQYDAFVCELVDSYSANHSCQWAISSCESLLKLVKNSEYDIEK